MRAMVWPCFNKIEGIGWLNCHIKKRECVNINRIARGEFAYLEYVVDDCLQLIQRTEILLINLTQNEVQLVRFIFHITFTILLQKFVASLFLVYIIPTKGALCLPRPDLYQGA